MNNETIAYCAGIFDGEGWIGIGSKNSIHIRIVNTHKPLIDYLVSLWGGRVYKRKKKVGNKQAYDFMLRDRESVVRFVTSVYPFLQCRKTNADVAIEKHRLLRKGKDCWL